MIVVLKHLLGYFILLLTLFLVADLVSSVLSPINHDSYTVVNSLQSSFWFSIIATISLLLFLVYKGYFSKGFIGEQNQNPLKIVTEKSKRDILDMISNDKRFIRTQEDRDRLVLRTKSSFFSFGEIVTIGIEESDLNHTKITISSRPCFKLNVLNFGKDYININYLGKLIIR